MHADHQGSTIARTDIYGTVTKGYLYNSFGVPANQGFDPYHYTYTGREWDNIFKVFYYRARYYDPAAGRFLSTDPIGFAGGDVNLFAYVGGNPVNWVDPWGYFAGIFGYFGFQGPDWHHQRNILNNMTCPPSEPTNGSTGCDANNDNQLKWQYDPAGSISHGGYKSYRGISPLNRGFQCVYNKKGVVVTEREFRGTFDYSPPLETLFGTLEHFRLDVLPWFLWGN